MDNVHVIVSDSSSSNSNNIVVMPVLVPPAYSNQVIDLGGFDLDEALAMVVAREPPAASKSLVSKLPAAVEVKEDDVCSVCMEGFHFQLLQGPQDSTGGGGNKRVPCGHVYHSDCITMWLSHCTSCPLCRRHISLH